MAEGKKCPVDRWKLMIALECCAKEKCAECSYLDFCDCFPKAELSDEALAYICYLEEQLGVTGL